MLGIDASGVLKDEVVTNDSHPANNAHLTRGGPG